MVSIEAKGQRTKKSVRTGGVSIELYHETYGTGRPLLMLHGFGASSFSWRNLIEPFSRTHQLILLDLKGFGKSPKPSDDLYGVQNHADLIYDFILRKNLRDLTLVGHSLGGAVALLTAIKLIDEKKGRLRSLILIDAAAFRQNLPAFIDILRMPILGPLAVCFLSDERQVRLILKKAYFDDSKITRDQIKAYSVPLGEPGGEAALVKTARRIVPRNIDRITRRYPEIKVPALIIWGREDEIVPLKVGNKLHQSLPNSKLIIIDKCGHIPHEEKPEAVIPALKEFLGTPEHE
jgi:pimeloyl-ACP methyl ester carboxylesterase